MNKSAVMSNQQSLTSSLNFSSAANQKSLNSTNSQLSPMYQSKMFKSTLRPLSRTSPSRIPQILTSVHRNVPFKQSRPASPLAKRNQSLLIYHQLNQLIKLKIESFQLRIVQAQAEIDRLRPYIFDLVEPINEIKSNVSKLDQRLVNGTQYVKDLPFNYFNMDILHQWKLTTRYYLRYHEILNQLPIPPDIILSFHAPANDFAHLNLLHKQRLLLGLGQELFGFNFSTFADFSQSNLPKLNQILIKIQNQQLMIKSRMIYDLQLIRDWKPISNRQFLQQLYSDAINCQKLLKFESINRRNMNLIPEIGNYVRNFDSYLKSVYVHLFDEQEAEMFANILGVDYHYEFSKFVNQIAKKCLKRNFDIFDVSSSMDAFQIMRSHLCCNNCAVLECFDDKQELLISGGYQTNFEVKNIGFEGFINQKLINKDIQFISDIEGTLFQLLNFDQMMKVSDIQEQQLFSIKNNILITTLLDLEVKLQNCNIIGKFINVFYANQENIEIPSVLYHFSQNLQKFVAFCYLRKKYLFEDIEIPQIFTISDFSRLEHNDVIFHIEKIMQVIDILTFHQQYNFTSTCAWYTNDFQRYQKIIFDCSNAFLFSQLNISKYVSNWCQNYFQWTQNQFPIFVENYKNVDSKPLLFFE